MGGKEIVMLVIVIVGFVFAVVAAVTRILGVGGWTRINYRMSTGILVMLTVVWGILIAAALGFGIYLFAVLKITGETAKTVLLVLLVVCPLIFNNGIISALVAYADKNGSLTKNQKIFYLVAFFLFPVGTLVFAALLAFTAARGLFGF